ncbi:hypothetical protein CYLTODRAFT_346741 [Cylindrobasidium torrendii FP15055 ss-10]|uniref:NadR/Ttd14 AAA domain-containing protein n=1 Tax=Cylindrobasidium torrendii FP15055 ss-10 TaxID=1314674 RepID=A0A0D7BKB4_9AGAR|nr:hypothetical protein CYLTODRAFT_346741 [Cylindrobasidium torrendii FP15055 ss-10]
MGNQSSLTKSPHRIYVVGPSSTGKTTLCDRLAEVLHLDRGTTYISEVARKVIAAKKYTRKDVYSLKMQEDIMAAQLNHDAESRGVYPLQVFDRSSLDPLVYAKLTGVDEADGAKRMEELETDPRLQEELVAYRGNNVTFVLLTPVQGWLVDDGTRHMQDQERTRDIFKETLSRLEIPFVEIGEDEKDSEARVALVLNAAGINS